MVLKKRTNLKTLVSSLPARLDCASQTDRCPVLNKIKEKKHVLQQIFLCSILSDLE